MWYTEVCLVGGDTDESVRVGVAAWVGSVCSSTSKSLVSRVECLSWLWRCLLVSVVLVNNKKSKGFQHGQRRVVGSYSVVWLSCVGASILPNMKWLRLAMQVLSLHVCFSCSSPSRLEA